MMLNPSPGMTVRFHYRKALRPVAPYHGRVGVVRIVGKGKPRNHGVEVDGKIVVVPAGHLRKV